MARLGDMLESFLRAQDRRTDEALRKAGVDTAGGLYAGATTMEARDLARGLNELGARDDVLQSWQQPGSGLIRGSAVGLTLPIEPINPDDPSPFGRAEGDNSGVLGSILQSNATSINYAVSSRFSVLVIFCNGRSTNLSTATQALRAIYNGDGDSNYSYQYALATNTTNSANQNLSVAFAEVGALAGDSNPSAESATSVCFIVNIQSAFHKSAIFLDGRGGASIGYVDKEVSTWRSTAPIQSMTLSSAVGDIKAGSQILVLGLTL
jgi:hypothetical protein